MIAVLIAAVVWLTVALALGLLIGRTIRAADRREQVDR